MDEEVEKIIKTVIDARTKKRIFKMFQKIVDEYIAQGREPWEATQKINEEIEADRMLPHMKALATAALIMFIQDRIAKNDEAIAKADADIAENEAKIVALMLTMLMDLDQQMPMDEAIETLRRDHEQRAKDSDQLARTWPLLEEAITMFKARKLN